MRIGYSGAASASTLKNTLTAICPKAKCKRSGTAGRQTAELPPRYGTLFPPVLFIPTKRQAEDDGRQKATGKIRRRMPSENPFPPPISADDGTFSIA